MEESAKKRVMTEQTANSGSLLHQLPELVIANLVSFLDIKEASRFCRISKMFNKVITKNNPQVVGISKYVQFLNSQLAIAKVAACGQDKFENKFARYIAQKKVILLKVSCTKTQNAIKSSHPQLSALLPPNEKSKYPLLLFGQTKITNSKR